MRKLNYILIFISLLINTMPTTASTDVNGTIDTNTIWDVNGSPYILVDNVTISSQATLIIEPEVEVNTPPGSGHILKVDGHLVAYDANFIGESNIDVDTDQGGNLELVECLVEGSVNLESGTTARMKYCRFDGSISIHSDANISITSNDFSELSTNSVQAVGDGSATINLEYNFWIEDPDYNDPNYAINDYIEEEIWDHKNDENLPRIDYMPFLPESPLEDADAGGDLQGQVYVNILGTAYTLTGAKVEVKGRQTCWTDHEGKFGFTGLDPGETTLRVTTNPTDDPCCPNCPSLPSQSQFLSFDLCYDVNETVLVGENSTTFVYVTTAPRLDSEKLTKPVVVEIRGKHSAQDRHTYYLNDVDLNQKFTATIDWGNYDPSQSKVKWTLIEDSNVVYYVQNNTSDTNNPGYESWTFNVDDLDKGGRLEVIAIGKRDGADANSDSNEANFNVINPPPGVLACLLKPDTSSQVIRYIIKGSDFWALNGFLRFIEVLNQGIPGFGGNKYVLMARAYATAKITGDGTASATFLKDHNFAPMEIDSVEIAPSASIELGWDYNPNLSPGWDPWEPDTEGGWQQWGIIGIDVEGSYTGDPHYKIVMVGPVPIPVYWRTGLILAIRDLDFTLTNWGWDPNSIIQLHWPKWTASPFKFDVLAELMLGVGIADHLAAEGFLGGGAEMHIKHDGGFNNLCIDDFYIVLYGGMRVYVFIFEYEKTGWHLTWKLDYVPSCEMMADFSSLNQNEFGPIDRDYLLKRDNGGWIQRDDYAKWFPDLTEAQKLIYLKGKILGPEEELLHYNVFPQSQPTIAAHGNDLFLAWVYDDPNRDPIDPNSVNRTKIVFSKYDSSTGIWSPNEPVDNDSTADFSPHIVTLSDGTAICVWEDTNRDDFPNNATLTDMAQAMEISTAHYNGDSWTQKWSTNNNYLDRSPQIAADDDKAIAVWIRNEGTDINDILGNGTNNENKIIYRVFDGENWNGEGTLATDLGMIVKTTLAYNANEDQAVYVYELDNDANLAATNTDPDRELHAIIINNCTTGSPTTVSATLQTNIVSGVSIPATNPQVVYDDNDDILLVWSTDANPDINIVDTRILSGHIDDSSGDLTSTPVDTISPTAIMHLSGAMDFRLAKAGDGRISIVWTEKSSDSNGIDIFTANYHSDFGIWGLPFKLTFDRDLEHSLAATFAGTGQNQQLTLAYNKVEIITKQIPDYTIPDCTIPPDTTDPNWCKLKYHEYPDSNRVDLYVLRHGLQHNMKITPDDITIALSQADVTHSWKVDFVDFSGFANQWLNDDCNSYNFWCNGCDFDRNKEVNEVDLGLLCEDWLWQSGGPNPPPKSIVDISALIHNVGDFAEENIPVAFYFKEIDPQWKIADTIIPGPIPSGDSVVATAEWTVPPIAIWSHQIYVVVDAGLGTSDPDKDEDANDNSSSSSVGAADLTVTQTTAKRIDPDKLGITARIANIGGVSAENIDVLICHEHSGQRGQPDRDNQIKSDTIASLEPVSFYDLRFIWDISGIDFGELVDIPIYVIADPNDQDNPDGTVLESDEDNNVSSALVQVGERN